MADTVTSKVTGGDKISKVLNGIAGKVAKGQHVNIGFLSGATYPATVHKPKQGGLSVATVAFWQEFGTVRSPPRPFFRTMIAQHKKEWGPTLAKLLKATDYDSQQALALLGEEVKAELQESIQHGDWQALRPITLMLRKMQDDDPSLVVSGKTIAIAAQRVAQGLPGATGDRAHPLTDTKVMLDAVAYQVVAK